MTQPSEGRGATQPELARAYVPAEFELDVYERWLAADVFAPDGAGSTADPSLPPFVIIQPPPNVTGSLHLGHAQRTTVEDLMVRHARMVGHPALFLPGLDHASIAAQFVLDGILAKEGESRASLGRERYLARMETFVAETRQVILMQQRRLGGSCDWGRLRYTMDEVSAKAVRVRLRAAVPGRPRLPHRGADQLVPGLQDERQRPRGDPHPGDGHAVARALPPHRRGHRRAGSRRDDHGRHHPARDDPRRHRRRGPSRRPALCRAGRTARPHPVRRARRADHRGRGRRSGVRHGRGEDHARPRPRRPRDGPSPRPRGPDDPRRRGARRGHGHRVRRPRPVRGAGRDRGGARGERRPRGPAGPRDGHRSLPAERRRRRAAAQDPVVHPHQAARRRRPRVDPLGRDGDPAAAVREDVGTLDDQHPGLERLPPAVVGTPDPGLVLPGRPRHGDLGARRAGRLRGLPADRRASSSRTPTSSTPGSARACGRSRRSAGPTRPRTTVATTRARSWRPATTSCSSGSPG